ncbi:hypothetical protein AVEN_185333-1 [Araneus ventricosus]|uniref:Uncharacterized protein n=1 Tax=Araneus ventricosus TaxID=182803 RepID=A0A4Y2UT16_ARAVE|nr:hypothetical protein AVEN_185333-1 [Araneus ventricosus]
MPYMWNSPTLLKTNVCIIHPFNLNLTPYVKELSDSNSETNVYHPSIQPAILIPSCGTLDYIQKQMSVSSIHSTCNLNAIMWNSPTHIQIQMMYHPSIQPAILMPYMWNSPTHIQRRMSSSSHSPAS